MSRYAAWRDISFLGIQEEILPRFGKPHFAQMYEQLKITRLAASATGTRIDILCVEMIHTLSA